MKRGTLLCQSILVIAGAAALSVNVQGDPVQTTSFAIDALISTDTFETAGGAVLFTTAGVGYSEALSPGLVAKMAADSTLPALIQSTLSLIPQVSDYDFLTMTPVGISDYYVLNGVGPASLGFTGNLFSDVENALVAAGGPGYSPVTPLDGSAVSAGGFIYTGITASVPSPWEGDIIVQAFDQNIVEKAPAAVPEPETLALLGAGMLTLITCARRRTVQ